MYCTTGIRVYGKDINPVIYSRDKLQVKTLNSVLKAPITLRHLNLSFTYYIRTVVVFELYIKEVLMRG